MASIPARTPSPPYVAVIFTSVRTDGDNGYPETAERMMELAALQDGFLGVESARDEIGITVSYWRDLQCVRAWKRNAEHRLAQEKGRSSWYSSFRVRVALVERAYSMGD